jgi:glyoxylase-like metal-dependent hydrolase (beta-lactamase superfamily II)
VPPAPVDQSRFPVDPLPAAVSQSKAGTDAKAGANAGADTNVKLPTYPPDMRPGTVTDVAPGVRRLVAPNPGMMTGPGTNTYLLGTGDLALVDPGPDDDAHLAAVLEAAERPGSRLRWILVTHTHIDHSPLAVRLKKATGAQVVAYGPSPVIPPHEEGFVPDRRMVDGQVLLTPEFRLAAVHTPGHASNHLCFDLEGLLFSGDHVMSGSTVVIAPPDGDMAAYLDSLERVRSRVPTRIAPGHGSMIDDPLRVLDEYLAHRRAREAEVLARLGDAGSAGATPAALVATIYQQVRPELHPVARYSVWAHLRKLADAGAVVSADHERLDAEWWTTDAAPASVGPAPARLAQGGAGPGGAGPGGAGPGNPGQGWPDPASNIVQGHSHEHP